MMKICLAHNEPLPREGPVMPMIHRPATELDLRVVCDFAQDAQELFFFFPKAQFPLTPLQLSQAVAERAGRVPLGT